MQMMSKSFVKYCIIFALFGVCANLIYLALPVYVMIVYDRVLFSFSESTLATMSLGLLISLIIMGLLDYCRLRIMAQAGTNLVQKMTPLVLKMMQKDAAGINRQGYTRGVEDLEFLRNALVQGQLLHSLDLPWVLIYLGILYIIHPLVGAVATVVLFMVTLFQILLRMLEKRRYTIADVALQTNAEFTRASLHHAELISGMGMFSPVSKRYQDGYNRILSIHAEAEAFHSRIGTVIRFLHCIGLAAVVGAGALAFFADKTSTGVIFAGVMIIARIFYPFEKNLANMKTSIEAMAAYKRLKYYVKLDGEKEKLSLPTPKGNFTAETVSLALNNKTVLHNISLALEPGETLGILGPSSSGKTSLCKVLLGIWPALVGKVRLDGAEIAQWPDDELGKHVGYMPQEPELFPVTVAENIARLFEVDSQKVVEAAQKAGVHEMILKLAQGYDTKIDQTGKNLSAGQRQLISLARALYDGPKLVVMDEPHTYLDDMGIRAIANALHNLKKEQTTVIVVSDRPNLIVNLDKLLVIKDGQVLMYGPSKEVLSQLAAKQKSQQAAGV